MMPDWLSVVFPLIWGLAGWMAAIPLNALVYQLPRSQPLGLHPQCASCGTPIPLLALPARAKCRCDQPAAYDRAEWLLAPLLVLLAIWFGPGGPVVLYTLHTIVLVTVAMIDLRHRYVYHITTLPPMILAVFLAPLLTGTHIGFPVAGAILGAAIFGGLYFVGQLIWPRREAIGKGDIQLAALIGAMDWFPRVVGALFLGSLVNAALIALLLVWRRRGPGDYVPYAPGLCLATYVTFFFPP